MLRFEKRPRELENGQSLVEMAFGLVVMLIILAGVLDLGRLYFTFVALEDAAGEAALFLSINPGCQSGASNPGPDINCANPNNANWRAKNAGGGIVNLNTTVVSVDSKCYQSDGVTQRTTCYPAAYGHADGVETGDVIEVKLTYHYTLMTPVIPEIAGANTIDLVSQATAVIIVVP